MVLQPEICQPTQPVGLAPADGFRRNTEPHGGPGLHLPDDDRAALAGDDVDLTFLTAPVAREDLQPGVAQMGDGDVLAIAPDRVLGPHLTTSAATMRCGGDAVVLRGTRCGRPGAWRGCGLGPGVDLAVGLARRRERRDLHPVDLLRLLARAGGRLNRRHRHTLTVARGGHAARSR